MSRYLLDHPRLNARLQTLGGHPEVPALPEIYMRLREVIHDPRGNASKVAEVLAKDPALVMKVLKTVNSPVYGLRQSVNKVEQAVALLGMQEISHLVLAATVIRQFTLRPGDRVMNLRKFWEHSLGVALFARILLKYAHRMRQENHEEAFIGGLIHDVGKLVLYQAFPEEYTRALNLCRDERKTMTQAENAVFGFTHQDIGAYVADEWGFSRQIVKALEVHNTPQDLDCKDSSFAFVSLIHLANILAHFSDLGNSGDPFLPVFYADCYGALGVRTDDLSKICAEGKSAFHEVDLLE